VGHGGGSPRASSGFGVGVGFGPGDLGRGVAADRGFLFCAEAVKELRFDTNGRMIIAGAKMKTSTRERVVHFRVVRRIGVSGREVVLLLVISTYIGPISNIKAQVGPYSNINPQKDQSSNRKVQVWALLKYQPTKGPIKQQKSAG